MSETLCDPHSISIVIPVYNEAKSIREVIERACSLDVGPLEKEILVCDDGSTDETPRIIRECARARPDLIKPHALPYNLGKGAAVRLGIARATGDIVVLQDADLELDPRELLPLVQLIASGETDVVYGSRFLSPGGSVPRETRWANWFLAALTNVLFGSKLTDMETGCKAFRRQVLSKLRLRCVRFDFEPEITAMLLKAGHSICEVPVSYDPRTEAEGKSISWVDGLDAVYTLLRCRFLA